MGAVVSLQLAEAERGGGAVSDDKPLTAEEERKFRTSITPHDARIWATLDLIRSDLDKERRKIEEDCECMRWALSRIDELEENLAAQTKRADEAEAKLRQSEADAAQTRAEYAEQRRMREQAEADYAAGRKDYDHQYKYTLQWSKRAEDAECDLATLREALEKIRDSNTPDVWSKVSMVECWRVARDALAAVQHSTSQDTDWRIEPEERKF